ncbi:MAG: hypothetical protein A2Z06_03920 [Candidatus Glassbacteria bacterium RBG_16_58_8]|uniref:RES domain-containing protein n=1 Tax=Candidatus Glassbacteria bacterium RBG_16_58_8 TaxID=1817866 RepID=A0A1F5YCJ8_9BACT|nr:MAG: hypothetical protein A2Z06_03920 [Candidatus Glassbacteria bacterium RBG_16_58_8]
MPRAWRIIKNRYAAHAFDGEGSRLYGSRWTSPGIRVVHASESLSLAVLEVLVHLQTSAPLVSYSVYTVDFPEDLVEELDKKILPENWRDYPAPTVLRAHGDAWVRRKSSVLIRVPSVVIIHEFNFLINPSHKDFNRLEISRPKPLDFDPRFFGHLGHKG